MKGVTSVTTVTQEPGSIRSARNDLWMLAGMALIPFLYQMFTTATADYGYFIDELYYIACSRHLAFGYVDHPPLSVALLALSRSVLGDSLAAIRFLPALAGAGTVFMTGLLARQLGGSRWAMVLAALASMANPIYLLMGSFYSMNAFEPLIWAAFLYFMIRLVQEENPRWWIAIGVLMGVGLEMKHTLVAYALALGIGMFLTPARRFLWSRWLALGVLVAGLLIAPNLIWQWLHGFPSLEFYHNAMKYKNIPTGPVEVLLQQVLLANLFALPLWGAGLLFFFFARGAARYRFVGWTYLVLLAMMIASKSSRPDRIAAIYTLLFAGGAVALQGLSVPVVRRGAMALMTGMLILSMAITAPISTPLLSPKQEKRFLTAIGFNLSIETGKRNDALPQWLGDRLGWREMAEAVAQVYRDLPEEDQKTVVFISGSYGHAGALDLYGPELGLPPRVYSTNNTYHLWGPPPESAQVYIGVAVNRSDYEQRFQSVREAAVFTCEMGSSSLRQVSIYVMRTPKGSVTKAWPDFRNYV
jgi:MFS family permease